LLGVIILFFGFNILYSLNFNYSNNSIDFKNIQQTQSQEKLTFITQNNQPQEYCGDGKCNSMETCSTCPTDCGQCKQPYNFKFYDNQEPYYSTYCDKINPYDLTVREAAAKAIRDDAGTYSINQLFDIYDWVKNNIVYQNVPLVGIPYPAKETIATESGDCKNQAVLIASMIEAIGGTAKVVADPSCTHAYSIVRFGSIGEDLSLFDKAVAKHYGINVQIEHFTNEDGIWVIFDPAGGKYPGNTLSECTGNRTVYLIDSCLSCVNQYPNNPYTFEDKCYSECPSGTISKNNYACSPCPVNSWSYNNECVTCENGSILHTNGRCYPNWFFYWIGFHLFFFFILVW